MSDPVIVNKAPVVMELEPGTYYWCSCGKSAKQPFCDGSHKGTDFRPHPFTVDENKKIPICQCKQTKNAPFCDGAHKRL